MVGTKTEARCVPLHQEALKILGHLETEKHQERSLVFIADDHGHKHVPYQYFRWKFRRSKSEASFADGSKLRENIDFYIFRHTGRTRMAKCGVQDSAAELIIGHADGEMQRTYTHYREADLISEIKKLSFPEVILKL